MEACEKAAGKFFKLTVNIGDEQPVPIVTSWDGVGVGSRVVIAVVGSFVADVEVTPVERGGVVSQGLLCDSLMLGWAGGTSGSAVLLPTSFVPGMPAPPERPRRNDANVEDPRDPNAGAEALFGPVLSKEEKKALAAKKKAEREAKKKGGGAAASADADATAEGGEADGTSAAAAAGDAAAGEAPAAGAAKKEAKAKPRVAPTKADLKRIKKVAAEKRKATGGEVFTDDELEAAGFLLEGEEPVPVS